MELAVTDATGRSYPFQRKQPFVLPEELAWLRVHEPISRITLSSGDQAWLVTRYEDARAILSDNQRFSRNLSRPGAARIISGTPFDNDEDGVFANFGSSLADPPGHTRWRRLVGKAFTGRQAEAMRGRIQAITDELLDEVEARTPPADLMGTVAYRLPITVIWELLGIPAEDQSRFWDWSNSIISIGTTVPWEEAVASIKALVDYAHTLITAKRRRLGKDLLSTLIAVHDEDNTKLTDDELVSTTLILLVAGYESTAVQFGNGLLALFKHSDQLAALAANPALIVSTVEETLRWALMGTGFSSARYAISDVEIGGCIIPKGSTVFVSIGSANRDETQFENPDEFLVARESAHRHLTFGAGPAFCLGASLARVELQVLFSTLVQRFPNIRLAIPFEDVRWKSNLFSRLPESLPVTWDHPGGPKPPDLHAASHREGRPTTLRERFADLERRVRTRQEKIASLTVTFAFIINGDDGGSWTLEIRSSQVQVREGAADNADMTCTLSAEDFMAMTAGEVSGSELFFSGRMNLQGNALLGMTLAQLIS
jgi:cytochrome P450/putative sterol carrier protein